METVRERLRRSMKIGGPHLFAQSDVVLTFDEFVGLVEFPGSLPGANQWFRSRQPVYVLAADVQEWLRSQA